MRSLSVRHLFGSRERPTFKSMVYRVSIRLQTFDPVCERRLFQLRGPHTLRKIVSTFNLKTLFLHKGRMFSTSSYVVVTMCCAWLSRCSDVCLLPADALVLDSQVFASVCFFTRSFSARHVFGSRARPTCKCMVYRVANR